MDQPRNHHDDPPSLRVLAADEDEAALGRTAAVLEELGHEVVACTASVREACDLIAREDPDASVVVVHSDPDHALDLIDELSEASSGPVVAVHGEADGEFAEEAARRGLAALAASASAEGLQGALAIALQRHREAAQLHEQVGQLQHALERRATIERAKGMLMERRGVGEREAFELLRSSARSCNRTVVSLAADVAAGQDLPVPGPR